MLRRLGGVIATVALLVVAGCAPTPRCQGCLPRAAVDKTNVFAGLGAWWDVYDWSPSFSPGTKLGVADVDRLARDGVQVLYIQSGKANRPELVLDRDRFVSIFRRAHLRGLRVVPWYLPAFVDAKVDVPRLVEPLKLGVDGIAMDIESRDNPDLALRNKLLVFETWFTRFVLPDVAMAAIVLPPVVTDVINPAFWPQFPWGQIAKAYDAWMPMGYWTNRTTASGWRDGGRYTTENIDRVRAHVGDRNAAVHPVGGIANEVTPAEVGGFVAAARSRGSIGASLYDDRTSTPDQYLALQPMRR
jgi:hypothetical protein